MSIKDSGARTQFYDDDGTPLAQRDVQDGKGRCDLLPLDVLSPLLPAHDYRHRVVMSIADFTEKGDVRHLYAAIEWFCEVRRWDIQTMLLETSIHFEEGAKKYTENNWRNGMPLKNYVNSSVRHYLKWLRGDQDEPHDRAVCWNLLAAIWTCKHKPRLNNYAEVSK